MKIDQVKSAMLSKSLATYCNLNYHITGCIMRICENAWYYQLELHDLKANSVIIARIEDVEIDGGKI